MSARFVLFLVLMFATCAHAATRPNVILIVADDLGFSDLGCYGSEIKTPNIDSLAQRGVRFSQFYNMARCCPTRASLMTGLYPHQAGVGAMCQDLGHPSYRGELSTRCKTLPEVLKSNGYRTAMVGKWHLSNLTISIPETNAKQLVNFERDAPISPSTASWPINRGFEEHLGTIAGVGSFFDPYSLVHNEAPMLLPKDFYYTDFINDEAAKFVDRFADEDKPFFLYVAHTAPHWPMQARESDIEKYKNVYEVGWDKIREQRHRRLIELGLISADLALSPRAGVAWDDAPNRSWEARRMAVYAAMIDCMDRGVGRIIETLRKRGLEKNTLVIFLSDNGGCAENVQREWYDIPTRTRDGREIQVGNDPQVMPGAETTFQSYGPEWANASNTPFRRFKHWTEEGGISAPCIVSGPSAIKRNNEIEKQVGHVIDVMPTILAACGVADSPLSEGKSLVPALQGEKMDRGPLFWEHEGNRAVRIGNFKLVAAHREDWQLYDLERDRTESNNLAEKMPEKVGELKNAYDEWAKRTGVLHWPVKKSQPGHPARAQPSVQSNCQHGQARGTPDASRLSSAS